MRQSDRQAGFSVSAIIAIIAVVAVIGAAGWLVYQHNRTKATNAAPNTNQTGNQPATTTTPAPTVAYLTIKEWGVKLPLPSAINDAYYVPAIGSSKGSDGQPNTLLVGLKSLDSSGCAATNTTALTQIFRASPSATDGVTGKLLTQEYPNGITIGNYFYAYEGINSSGTCKAPQATLQSVDSAFTSATKGMVTATTN